MEFFNVKTVQETHKLIKQAFVGFALETVTVDIEDACGRVLAQDIVSAMDVPHFDRSVVDGYAVRTADVQGAGESIPAFLKVIGRAQMGQYNRKKLFEGQCMYVPTGGMVPGGAEAVIMIEHTRKIADDEIAVYNSASMYENMLRIGDDIRCGDVVLGRGKTLCAQDVGALASTGSKNVLVFRRPKFAVISTGNEIVPPDRVQSPGKINDINTYTICAQVESFGGEIVLKKVIGDDFDLIKAKIIEALGICDVVLISGGSSVGEKDYTYTILNEMHGAEMIVHGLAIKPGKPTIVANASDKPVIGLPGQPASALIVLRQMLDMLDTIFYGRQSEKPYIVARLDQNVASAPGRKTFQMVSLYEQNGVTYAKVLRGKSGMISLLSRAWGYIVIGENKEGEDKGEYVKVFPLM